jgi:hypothetical protein
MQDRRRTEVCAHICECAQYREKEQERERERERESQNAHMWKRKCVQEKGGLWKRRWERGMHTGVGGIKSAPRSLSLPLVVVVFAVVIVILVMYGKERVGRKERAHGKNSARKWAMKALRCHGHRDAVVVEVSWALRAMEACRATKALRVLRKL